VEFCQEVWRQKLDFLSCGVVCLMMFSKTPTVSDTQTQPDERRIYRASVASRVKN